MKPLDNLDNIDRARLLHQLFPDEIPAFIDFTVNLCEAVLEEQDKIKAQWNNPIIPFDLWLELAASIRDSIKESGGKLSRNTRMFTDQLFDGYHAIFMAYSLEQYTVTRKHPNGKFTQAVALLFSL